MGLLALGLVVFGCASPGTTSGTTEAPFPFDLSDENSSLAPIQEYKTSDGVILRYRSYTAQEPQGVVVLIHGGGAHSGAGYPVLAQSLASESNLAVVTPDLRGHGSSDGLRGESPSVSRLYKDLDEIIDLVGTQWPGLPLTLMGHSSGAGFLVNYAAQRDIESTVANMVFVAPFLGFRSDTERLNNPNPFSTSKTWPFVLNAMSLGFLFGNYHAVSFNYPPEVLAREPQLLTSISVNTANATTPKNPQKDLHQPVPLAIWIGEEDETIDPARLREFVETHSEHTEIAILPGVTHLGILAKVAPLVGEWISRRQ